MIIKSEVLGGEFIIACASTKEYDDELKQHKNMIAYHPQETKQVMSRPPEKIRELHELKKYSQINRDSSKGEALMAAHLADVFGMISDLFPEALKPAPLSISEMRKKIKEESC